MLPLPMLPLLYAEPGVCRPQALAVALLALLCGAARYVSLIVGIRPRASAWSLDDAVKAADAATVVAASIAVPRPRERGGRVKSTRDAPRGGAPAPFARLAGRSRL